MMRWYWVHFQCRGVLLICIIVGHWPIALAVGAGGGCLDIFFSRLSFLFSFSLSLGDGPISIEILSQRAVKPQINQPTSRGFATLAKVSIPSKIAFFIIFTSQGFAALASVEHSMASKILSTSKASSWDDILKFGHYCTV